MEFAFGSQFGRSQKHYAEALSLYSKLAEEFPDEASYRQGVASTRNAFGMSLRCAMLRLPGNNLTSP